MSEGSVVTAFRRRWREPIRRYALAVTVVALGGLGFLPQLGGPGYDSALVNGLVLPALVAVAASVEAARTRPPAHVAIARGAELGVVLALAGFVVLLLHGAR